MDPHGVQPSPGTSRQERAAVAAPKSQRACEACRAVKLKCLPETHGAPCRRCSEFKRECVYRTRPRTRMSRAARRNNETPAASIRQQTFSIDFQMPADEPTGPAFNNLLQAHKGYIETLLPDEASFDDSMPLPSPPQSSVSSPAHGQTRTVQSLCLQPHFNLESATSLLDAFRHKLPYFPCIVLGEDETVASLARERPFVLLAILASVSESRTFRAHALYDEEFRKVLALKVVAGGERTLELAQGLLIYCAWFPFHLRPKDKRAFQYIRMVVDMVRDLDLDHSPSASIGVGDVAPDQVDGIRVYLSCCYLLTAFTSFWPRANNSVSINFTSWTATCWAALPTVSPYPQDHTLAHLARHAYVIRQVSETNRRRHDDSDQLRLVILGLEAQLQEWKSPVPDQIAQSRGVVLGELFTEVFIYCAPLMKFPAPETFLDALTPNPSKVLLAVPLLRRYYEEVMTLDLRALSAVDWGRLVFCVILGLRLSFPIKGFESWDDSRARADLRLPGVLDAFCDHEGEHGRGKTTEGGVLDVCQASSFIFGVARRRYSVRLERLERQASVEGMTCPMLDGSFDEYLRTWDGESGSNDVVDLANVSPDITAPNLGPGVWGELGMEEANGGDEGVGRQMYHDLWATMTMSWAENQESDTVGPL